MQFLKNKLHDGELLSTNCEFCLLFSEEEGCGASDAELWACGHGGKGRYIVEGEEVSEYIVELPVGSAFEHQEGGKHYKKPIDLALFLLVNNVRGAESNVMKYAFRHKEKDGAKDIKKAIHYLRMILEVDYGIITEVNYK